MSYRAWIIRSFSGLIWKASAPARGGAAARFAEIERDSAHQFLFAAELADDPELKAQLLVNSLDEHRHADWFERCTPPEMMRAALPTRRRHLVSELGGLERFLAYAAVSERAVSREFASYARAFGSPEFRELFERIRLDEQRHGDSCREPLDRLVGDAGERRRLLRWARYLRHRESLQRFGNVVGGALASIAFGLIYLVFCASGRSAARRRLGGFREGRSQRAPSHELDTVSGSELPSSERTTALGTR